MPNFFVKPDDISNKEVHIFAEDARHIARSLRMAVGDDITVSDGEGTQYCARLTKIRDEECTAQIIKSREEFGESPVKITLFMAYPKADKLELIVQKATELGAFAVVPFESARCIKRPKADKTEKTTARLERIAREAAKQCSRSRIPKISEPISFKNLAKVLGEYDLTLFCYEDAPKDASCRHVLSEQSAGIHTVAVIVGCEGGFAPDEAELLISAGATPVSLGERILRCETAPDFVLSALSYHFELAT